MTAKHTEKMLSITNEMTRITDDAQTAGRDLTQSEIDRISDLEDDFQKQAKQAANFKKVNEVAARIKSSGEDPNGLQGTGGGGTGQHGQPAFITSADRALGRNGVLALARGQRFAPEGSKDIPPNAAGEVLRSMACGSDQYTPASIDRFMATQNTGTDSSGGYLVPAPIWAGLIDLARAASVMSRAGTTTYLLDSETLSLPTIVSDPTIDATAEASPITISDITFGNVLLKLKKLAGIVNSSNELIESGIDTAARIQQTLASAVAAAWDNALLNGPGTGAEVLGLFQQTSIDKTTVTGPLTRTVIDNAVLACENRNHTPNVCVLSPANWHAISLEQASTSGVWQGAPPSSDELVYLPSSAVLDTEACVGDFTKYATAMKAGIRLEVSRAGGDAWVNDLTSFRAVTRIDGAPMDAGAFQIMDGLTV